MIEITKDFSYYGAKPLGDLKSFQTRISNRIQRTPNGVACTVSAAVQLNWRGFRNRHCLAGHEVRSQRSISLNVVYLDMSACRGPI